MSRIGSYGASQMYLSRLLATQQRVNTEQVQVATEKKSVNYTGIAPDTNRLLNLENEKGRAQEFLKTNDNANTRLKAADVSLTAIRTTMKNFSDRLDQFAQNMNTTQQDVEQLQTWAYQAMVDMQSYLAANVDGQYIFSGGRVADEPVKLPASTLQQFQQMFDGNVVSYPTTRTGSLADVHLAAADTGPLTFDTATGTIKASTNAFDSLQPGTRLTMGGLSPATTFTVQSVNAATNQITVSRLATETTAGATINLAGTTTKLTSATTGNLTFSPQGDTITGATAGSLAGLTVGTVFQVSGCSANGGSNNGTYEVTGYNAATNTVTVKSSKLDFVQPTTTEATAVFAPVSPAYGTLTFSSNASGQPTISATNAGSLAGYAVGSTFTLSGSTAAGNDGTYKVVATNGSNQLTVTRVTGGTYTVPTTANTTFDADSWYRGDNLQIQQRIDADRTVDLGIYASDPAFEKAFRAMGLIAQGAYGTAGGLDNNMQRIDQARFLMKDAISRNGNGAGPFGTEQVGDMDKVQSQVGVTANLIKTKNAKHTSFAGFLDQRIIDLENVDKTEAVARLLDDQTALQTSYQALATVRGLSLLNYMK